MGDDNRYEYKYKKYKLKYDKLKNMMTGGAIDIEKAIDIVKTIVAENLEYFMELCDLDYEVGGFFDIDKQKYMQTHKGLKDAHYIENMVHFPYYEMLKIGWHTHVVALPQIYSEDGNKVGIDHPWINAVPSGIDYGTNASAVVYYRKNISKEETVVDCVISKRGVYFYWMQDELANFLCEEEDKDELNTIIYEYLVQNLDNDSITGMKSNSIAMIQELTKKSFTTPDKSFGFNSVFVPVETLQP